MYWRVLEMVCVWIEMFIRGTIDIWVGSQSCMSLSFAKCATFCNVSRFPWEADIGLERGIERMGTMFLAG